jgi:hypothetical protein
MAMDLKEFVAKSLLSITEGVVEAQKKALEHGALVNPGGLTRNISNVEDNAIWDKTTNNYARLVKFDVAVTAEEGTATNAKIGVLSGVLNLGAGGESENKNAVVSRLQFSVPVLFPVSKAQNQGKDS